MVVSFEYLIIDDFRLELYEYHDKYKYIGRVEENPGNIKKYVKLVVLNFLF